MVPTACYAASSDSDATRRLAASAHSMPFAPLSVKGIPPSRLVPHSCQPLRHIGGFRHGPVAIRSCEGSRTRARKSRLTIPTAGRIILA